MNTPAFGTRRLHGAAIVRILFGLVWLIDAIFKWMPGFIQGQTLPDELGGAAKVQIPVIHEWMQLWNTIGLADPPAFAAFIGVLETLVAVALILGAFSNVAFIGSAILSLGIWTGAEGMHLPWFTPGQTDLGPSVGYIFASLGLFFAAAGSTWSVDALLAPRLGRLSWLASPVPRGVTAPAAPERVLVAG
jgi:thiosulfate dehydrogenase [quinone] large subunit